MSVASFVCTYRIFSFDSDENTILTNTRAKHICIAYIFSRPMRFENTRSMVGYDRVLCTVVAYSDRAHANSHTYCWFERFTKRFVPRNVFTSTRSTHCEIVDVLVCVWRLELARSFVLEAIRSVSIVGRNTLWTRNRAAHIFFAFGEVTILIVVNLLS